MRVSNRHHTAKVFATVLLALAAPGVSAHDSDGATLVTFDLTAIAVITVAALGYAHGIARLRHRRGGHGVGSLQMTCFAAGIATLMLALIWPLDALSERSFAAHMAQHMLLIAVAPPLLVLGAPLAPFAAFAPLRRGFAWLSWSGLVHPSFTFALHAAIVWVWHAPRLFQAAVRSDPLHTLEHATVLGSALLFWWSLLHIVRARPGGYGVSTVLLLLTMMHTGLLGALLTFAPRPLYPVYEDASLASGLTPLEDQQVAGLIMWVAGGFFYLVAGLALAAAWLRHAERHELAGAPAGRPP